MSKPIKIFVAGHQGMVGSAIVRELEKNNNIKLICRSRKELDLIDQGKVEDFIYNERPDQVYFAAAKVGGIYANNTYPAEFIYENIIAATNVIHAAWKSQVKKLLFLGSSCIYPRLANQPISESSLLSGPLESTNEPYAIAKIAGIKLCESYNRQYGISHGVDYRSVMPTNLYGPGDNYHSENSHVIPALIRKFHEAKANKELEVQIWGTGKPRREFLFVDDLAEACLHVMNLPLAKYQEHSKTILSHVNIGVGEDITIKDLALKIASIVGYKGSISFDLSKPDGSPRKLMDSTLVNKMGWKSKVTIEEGLKSTYQDFKLNHKTLRM